MTYRAKNNRIYPYNTGLLLGSEVDVIITNENSEPLDAYDFFDKTGTLQISVDRAGGGENQGESCGGNNFFKQRNGMVRLYTKQSYCRAYATDNIWYLLKSLVIHLKKRAFLSSVPAIMGEDLERLEDGRAWVAAGHMKFSVKSQDIYDTNSAGELRNMTHQVDNEAHARLLDNIRITVGLIALLLDRRDSAAARRREYGPFNGKEFRKTDTGLTYQTPTNFWLYSPTLAHLMFGAGRFAYFITQNNFECDVWEGFESGDIKNAIHRSDYDTGMEIWRLMRSRVQDAGYTQDANPFAKRPSAVLEMLFDHGVGQLGDGVYKNWRMNRKMCNYHGHFDDLPSWENGTQKRIFTEKHPMYKIIQGYLESQKNVK